MYDILNASRYPVTHEATRGTHQHNIGVITTTMASQVISLTVVYSTVYSDVDQRKHQSSASLAFVRGIHRGPVNSPHKWPVTRKMLPFDDVIMIRGTHQAGGLPRTKCDRIIANNNLKWHFVTENELRSNIFFYLSLFLGVCLMKTLLWFW